MPQNVLPMNAELMECLFEKAIKKVGFVCIRDGSKGEAYKQWGEEAGKPTYFTRVYQFVDEGANGDRAPMQVFAKFNYDLRTGYADFSMSRKDFTEFKRIEEQEAKAVAVQEPEVEHGLAK